MKIQYKNQNFQTDAAKAVVDVFSGQPYVSNSYIMDSGQVMHGLEFTGWNNNPIIQDLSGQKILDKINEIQRKNQLKPDDRLFGKYNLTIEMETGVGKTFTYIKTMYELNKAYGWCKFIIVVPSIAIREGVYKTFQTTEDYFALNYQKKIRYFIYNSTRLTDIEHFASDSSINVMIINSQAFNATGKDARRIYMKLDEFRSRRPIDVIAKTNPILIIDEPQSVEGEKTKERLKEFNPLMTLRYSATHRENYNMIYRLDAMDAYNKRLVKKIRVTGITQNETSSTDSYIYLAGINLSSGNPTATIEFNFNTATGTKKITRTINEGYNLYDNSNGREEYKNNFIVTRIDGRDNLIEFMNGIKLFAGEVTGKENEDNIRAIQIRETIEVHLERERQLFYKGIKVLSLFFIDEVANYRVYGSGSEYSNGKYADIFEEQYAEAVEEAKKELAFYPEYLSYLDSIDAKKTHAGYFSQDKKGHFTESKLSDKKEKISDDVDAYDLIMKDKELLLDRDPKKSPVRFIFSHSALREGWDNPNVFQICTLKQSGSDIRKRQEVGRGLRLCINENGERMDESVLGNDVHNINCLTIIASESYEHFAKELQTELAEAVGDRPVKVTAELFKGRELIDKDGNKKVIDKELSDAVFYDLVMNQYIDKKGVLTEKYYADKANGTVEVAEKAKEYADAIIAILDSVYNPALLAPEDTRKNNVTLSLNDKQAASKEFKELWSRINHKAIYAVDFDTDELINKAIATLDTHLKVAKVTYTIKTGSIEEIQSKSKLAAGSSFVMESHSTEGAQISLNKSVKYNLIGKLVEETSLTRKTIVGILKGILPSTFNQFKDNPEEFIIKAGNLINEEKATAVVQHITYNVLDETYDMQEIFAEAKIKGKLDVNVIKTKKHLYDHLVFDSLKEKDFAVDLDTSEEVAVYVKLPKSFFIPTPMGHYNPDWAIAFYEGKVKHIYFVAETKGSLSALQLRGIEDAKIQCARKHFEALNSDKIKYDVVTSYKDLMERVMK
ncbi:MAG: DEAD/DEAH box helicase family protein [Treponema sp.]|nr:DEAD/DEAH box helicase family protein [Treponema sp.]